MRRGLDGGTGAASDVDVVAPYTASSGLPQVLWSLGAVGLAASAALVVMSVATGAGGGPVVVLGVVPRAWWGFVPLHVVGAALLCCATLVRWSREVDEPSSRRSRVDAVMVAAATAGVYVASLVCVLVGLLLGSFFTYSVLEPASDAGCRVVAREGTVSGAGELYVLPAGATRPRVAGAYSGPMGHVPISEGAYRLRWDGETALLAIRDAQGPATAEHPGPLPCR